MAYFPARAQTAKRQQGILNRKTQEFELALWLAYEAQDGFGGMEGLKRFAKDQPTEFFKAIVKRLPIIQEEQEEQRSVTIIVSGRESVQVQPPQPSSMQLLENTEQSE